MLIKTGRRSVAIAMAQNNFAVAWANIFLDCINCDQSIGLKFDSNTEADNFSDAEATAVFNKEGWAIEPTLCPRCGAGDVK